MVDRQNSPHVNPGAAGQLHRPGSGSRDSNRGRSNQRDGSRKRSFTRSPNSGAYRRKSTGRKMLSSERMCHDFLKGRCIRGAGCRYSHTIIERKSSYSPGRKTSPYNKDRKKSPVRRTGSSSPSRGPAAAAPPKKSTNPCRLFAAGNCHYGANCIYVHDKNAKPSASAPATPNARKTDNSPAPNTD